MERKFSHRIANYLVDLIQFVGDESMSGPFKAPET